MGLNITSESKEKFTAITAARWGTYVKYLGVKLADLMDPTTLIDLNVTPIMNSARMQLEQRQKLHLSWFGWVAAFKMKVLTRFIFVFQNLILPMPQGMLNEIQHIFNSFCGVPKKAKIKAALLQ